ncbi:MAG TPA: hypothetical protein VFS66_00485 [Acidimicrobiia bacterium]|nr:hypothetical protein [Acidimicrobiia bacterium]
MLFEADLDEERVQAAVQCGNQIEIDGMGIEHLIDHAVAYPLSFDRLAVDGHGSGPARWQTLSGSLV